MRRATSSGRVQPESPIAIGNRFATAGRSATTFLLCEGLHRAHRPSSRFSPAHHLSQFFLMSDRGRTLEAAEVGEFIATLETYETAIPDHVVEHYLARAGFQTDDRRVVRLVALAAQKFIADVAHEAMAQRRIQRDAQYRQLQGMEDEKVLLTTEELKMALQEHGIHLSRVDYFADSVDGVMAGGSAAAAGGDASAGGGGGGGASAAPRGTASKKG